ncbi:Uncharacterized protein FWK35_00030025 [Aphis craccivora]|uniref:Uncharacterized protein n=1 Tax=Aphis craccivora TaxID=307492 RepID=A0A6G0X0A8_APHCR|nr:Uncharacterized protein FWK35_00030025 [Aphis craccivora]
MPIRNIKIFHKLNYYNIIIHAYHNIENNFIKNQSRQSKALITSRLISKNVNKIQTMNQATKIRNFSKWTINYDSEEDIQLILNQIKHDNCSLLELE